MKGTHRGAEVDFIGFRTSLFRLINTDLEISKREIDGPELVVPASVREVYFILVDESRNNRRAMTPRKRSLRGDTLPRVSGYRC